MRERTLRCANERISVPTNADIDHLLHYVIICKLVLKYWTLFKHTHWIRSKHLKTLRLWWNSRFVADNIWHRLFVNRNGRTSFPFFIDMLNNGLLVTRFTYSVLELNKPCMDKFSMTTSSNGNIFRVTGHLCGEFTGPRWIPHIKTSDAELWCFLWSAPELTVE